MRQLSAGRSRGGALLPGTLALPALFLAVSPALISPAFAAPKGMVVRLETGVVEVEGPVSARLVSAEGQATTIALHDDGKEPDVMAGDHLWGGSAWFEGDSFTVAVTAGGRTLQGGSVSWKPGDTSRDLVIRLSGSDLFLEAGVPPAPGDAAPPAPPPGGTEEATDGGTPASGPPPGSTGAEAGGETRGSSGASTHQDPAQASSAPSPSSGSVSTGRVSPGPSFVAPIPGNTSWLALGAGALTLWGVSRLWAPRKTSLATSLSAVPEAPLLGPGTPSMSGGPWRCRVAPEDHEEAVQLLLQTLAVHHRVVYVGPPLGAVRGRVFQPRDPAPAAVFAAAGLLLETGAAVALVLDGAGAGPGHPEWGRGQWREKLPDGLGVVIVGEGAGEGMDLPTAGLSRADGRWRVEGSRGVVTLSTGATGFEAGG